MTFLNSGRETNVEHKNIIRSTRSCVENYSVIHRSRRVSVRKMEESPENPQPPLFPIENENNENSSPVISSEPPPPCDPHSNTIVECISSSEVDQEVSSSSSPHPPVITGDVLNIPCNDPVEGLDHLPAPDPQSPPPPRPPPPTSTIADPHQHHSESHSSNNGARASTAVMESPTSTSTNNNNNHTDDQQPPPSSLPIGNNNNTDPNGNAIDEQCFTNSCYVASEPSVVVQQQPVSASSTVLMASQVDALNLNAIDLENGNVVAMSAKERELVQEILVRERRIRELEDALRLKNEEVAELRSHLDKFQSVFPFNNQRSTPIKGKFSGMALPSCPEGLASVASEGNSASSQQQQQLQAGSAISGSGGGGLMPQESAVPSGNSGSGGGGGVAVVHRQRAQGISAEPQSSRSMFELLNVTFPKFDKEER